MLYKLTLIFSLLITFLAILSPDTCAAQAHTSRLSEMRASLAEQLALDVDIFDPFEVVKLGSQARTQIPEDRGRYAALL